MRQNQDVEVEKWQLLERNFDFVFNQLPKNYLNSLIKLLNDVSLQKLFKSAELTD